MKTPAHKIGIMKYALFAAMTALASSCVREEPPPAPHVEKIAPHSKPLKMPPTNRKLGGVERITIDPFFQLQQSGNALIYDVRVPYFHAIDHIPGAINWPHTAYEEQVQQRDIEIQEALNSGKKIVVYCFNPLCPEARDVARKLARRDYVVHVFAAGIDTWREAELPLESGTR